MQLKNLLQKHNQTIIKKDFLILAVVDCIVKKTKIQIKKEDCIIKNNILYIKTKPIYKEKIINQKENLLILLKDFTIIDII